MLSTLCSLLLWSTLREISTTSTVKTSSERKQHVEHVHCMECGASGTLLHLLTQVPCPVHSFSKLPGQQHGYYGYLESFDGRWSNGMWRSECFQSMLIKLDIHMQENKVGPHIIYKHRAKWIKTQKCKMKAILKKKKGENVGGNVQNVESDNFFLGMTPKT